MISERASQRHPIAVMIDDLSPARPQSGLQSASIVWHAPAEGGIPRYMAIFADTLPEDVGPVRSARLYFVQWASEWKAVYVHAGGSPQALATLASKGRGQLVYNADQFRYGAYFRRVPDRFAPHNLYTTLANLRKLSAAVGAEPGPLEQKWKFAPDIPLEQRPQGGSITVSYPANTITYRYNRKANTYRRSVSVEGDAARRVERQADRAEERGRHARQFLAAQRRLGQEPPGSRHHRQRQGVDRDQRPNDQGHLAEEQDHRADPVLRRRRQARSR